MSGTTKVRGASAGRRPCRATRRGFVLLMALVLIALAGVLLVGIARHSLTVTAEAEEAADDLQRRWGTLFLTRAILSDPEPLIARRLATRGPHEPALPIRETFQLGGIRFHVVLDDDSRKLNANRLRAVAGPEQLVETLHQLGGAGVRVELRPIHAAVLGPRQFDSWGHVLHLTPSDNVREICDQIEPISEWTTCWGNGKVNVHRCGDEILHHVATLAAGPITANRLIALRRNEPRLETDQLLARLAVNRRKTALLKGWLSDDSHCYSLWVLSGQERGTLELHVRETVDPDAPQMMSFQW